MDRIYRLRNGSSGRYAVERGGSLFWVEGDVFGGYTAGAAIGRADVTVMAPVTPTKIVAVGLNYKDHAAEVKKPLPIEPLLFLKPSTAVIGPGEPIVIPAGAGRIDH